MLRFNAVVLSALCGSAMAAHAAPPANAAPAVPFPHPLISEVLYAVPTGPEGDADGDGTRSAVGDEFVELVNPHDKPINLQGYVLTDGKNMRSRKSSSPDPAPASKDKKPARKSDRPASGDDDARIRFVFPDLTLQPGEVVVVFNGYKGKGEPSPDAEGSKPAKRVDADDDGEQPRRYDDGGVDPKRVPKSNQPKTTKPKKGEQPADEDAASDHTKKPGGSRLSMNNTSQYKAFANTGDCVLLTDPTGAAVQCISWGDRHKPPEDTAPVMEHAPECRGSVVRVGVTKGMVSHMDRFGALFSPGTHPLHPAPAEDK